MKTVRILLLLVASAIVVLVAMILRRESERSPESVLSQARSLVSREEPNFNGALLTLEQGLQRLSPEHSPIELAPLALERMRVFRQRWDRSAEDRTIARDPGDLRRVLAEAQRFVAEFDATNPKAILLGTEAALELLQLDQASALAEQLLKVSPDPELRAQGLRSLGIIRVLRGDQTLEALIAQEGLLHPERSQELLALAQGRAAREASLIPNPEQAYDPRSAQAAQEPGTEVQAAALDYARGMRYFLQALELHADEASVLGLQNLALRAGRFEHVIDIGLLALDREQLAVSTAILSLTLKGLLARDRTAEANSLLRTRLKLNRDVPMDFGLLSNSELNKLCMTLLELDNQRALSIAAAELKDRTPKPGDKLDYTQFGYFYILLARVASENVSNIKSIIKRGEPLVESYPGQLMEYWSALGSVGLLRGNKGEAVRFLLKAAARAEREPRGPRMRQVTGEMWSKLGRTLYELGNKADAEGPLAHAMRLLPGEREALTLEYEDAGVQAILAGGRNPALLKSRPTLLDEDGRYPDMGPYEACFRASRCIVQGRLAVVRTLLSQVLRDFPGFPVALELLAEAELKLQEPGKALEYLIELEELGQGSEASRLLLAEIPAEVYRGPQLRRLLQLSPGESALMALLLRCQELGAWKRLLEILEVKRAAKPPASARLLGIHVQLNQGQTSAALKLFDGLEPEVRLSAAALGPGLRLVAALLRSEKTEKRGSKLARQLLAGESWSPMDLERGIDELFADGHIDLAREALARADAGSEPLGPGLLLRWAWSGALAGDAERDQEAREALARAEPYLESGQADFTHLLMDHDAGDRIAVAKWAERLLNSAFAQDDLQRALLLILAGRIEPAQQLIDRRLGGSDSNLAPTLPDALPVQDELALRSIRAAAWLDQLTTQPLPWMQGPDASWYQAGLADSIVLLLAVGQPKFAGWALARERGLGTEKSKTPFYGAISALAWRRLGFPERAERALLPFTKPSSSHAAHWRLREELAEAELKGASMGGASEAEERLLLLQQERLETIGALGDSAAKVSLIRARALSAKGRNEEAALYIQKIRSLYPEDPLLLVEAARSSVQSGDLQGAYALYVELLEAQGDQVQALLPELLSLLEQQAAAGQLSPAAHRARLASLEAIFPTHPALPLALAKMQLSPGYPDTTQDPERAMDFFRRLKQRSSGRSLEDQHPGAAEAWIKFLAEHDLPQATRLAEAELDAHPERAELWRLWLELLVEGGELSRAARIHGAISEVFDDPALQRNHGLLLIRTNRAVPRILMNSLKRMAPEDPQLSLALAMYTLERRFKPKDKAAARELCLDHWSRRKELQLDPADTARSLLRALGPGEPEVRAALKRALSENPRPEERSALEALNLLLAFPAEAKAEADAKQGG